MKLDRVSEGGIIITLKLKMFPSCGPDDVSGTTLKSRVRTRYLRHPAKINPQNSLKTLKSLWKLSKLFENSQDFKNSQNSNYSRKTLKTPKTLKTLQKLSKLSKNSQNSQNSQENLKTPKTPKTPKKISKLLKLFALVHFFWSDLPLVKMCTTLDKSRYKRYIWVIGHRRRWEDLMVTQYDISPEFILFFGINGSETGVKIS